MKRIILLTLGLAMLAGCAQDPAIVAGKGLLATQQTIVNIRRQAGVPCQKGVIPQPTCQQIGSIYEQSKPAYDAAVDAEALYLSNATPANQAEAEARKQDFLRLATEITALATKYGIKGDQ